MEPNWDEENYDVPEEVPVADGEASRFQEAERAKMDEFENEFVIPNLIEEIVVAPVEAWLGLLMLHRDDELREQHIRTTYKEDFVAELVKLYPESIYHAPFNNVEVRLLGSACATAISNIVYSNDGGKAHLAMQAKGLLRNGLWTVDHDPKNKQVVAITSQHAIDLQLFCCSVGLTSVTKTIMIDKVPRPVQTPKLVEKNVNQKETLPIEVKRIFSGLLQLKPGQELNASTLDTAPFVWKAIYHAVKDIKVPLSSLPLPLVYFKWVNLNFGYAPKKCNLDDVYYAAYPPVLKELSHTVANHCVMVGGVFLNARHFENEALKHSKCRHIGGEFVKDLCYYNTNSCVTWEMAGAAIENPNSGLGTEIASIRNARDFTGIWWNPKNSAETYSKCAGLVIPYDKNGVGLRKLKEWASLPVNRNKYFRIWCHYGSMPALWIERMASVEKFATKFNPFACDVLWKCMGVMAIYNMMASLNANYCLARAKGNKAHARNGKKSLYDRGVPTCPLFCTILNGAKSINYSRKVIVDKKYVPRTDVVPSFVTDWMPEDYIPGRWMVSSAEANETDKLREGFGHYAAYAEHLRGAHAGFTPAAEKADPDGFFNPDGKNESFSREAYGPPPKRAKADEEGPGEEEDF